VNNSDGSTTSLPKLIQTHILITNSETTHVNPGNQETKTLRLVDLLIKLIDKMALPRSTGSRGFQQNSLILWI